MDPLTNEGHLPLTNQADQLRTMNSVRPEQMVPKIETGIIDITPHSHLEHQSTLDSPQKIDSPINDDQGKAKNMYIQNNNKQTHTSTEAYAMKYYFFHVPNLIFLPNRKINLYF